MAEPKEAPINAAVAYLVAALGIGMAVFMIVGSLGNFGKVNDLPEYYAAAKMLMSGQAGQIYDTQSLFAQEHQLFPTLERGVALFLPPPAVPLLVPLLLIPAAVAPTVWTIILVLALGAALFNIIRWQQLNRHESLWLVGLVALSGPAVESVRLGQLAPLMLLALVAFARLAQRLPMAAGALLDILIFKPQQLFPILVFTTANGRRKPAVLALVVLLVLLAVALGIFGGAGFIQYVHLVSNPGSLEFMQPGLNPTVRGQLMRLLGPQTAVDIAAAATLVVATALIALIGWRQRSSRCWVEVCLCVAIPIGLVTSLHCHDYDLILMVPGLVALLKSRLWTQVHSLVKLLIMLGLAAFLMPFYNDIHYTYLLNGGLVNPHFLLLFALAVFMAIKAFSTPDQFLAAGQSAGDALDA